MLRPEQKVILALMAHHWLSVWDEKSWYTVYGRREMEKIEIPNFAMTPFLEWRLIIDAMNHKKGDIMQPFTFRVTYSSDMSPARDQVLC